MCIEQCAISWAIQIAHCSLAIGALATYGSWEDTRSEPRSSPFVKNEHPVVHHPVARLQVSVGIIESVDLHDVLFAHLVEKIGQDFIEMILANLHAIEVPDALDAKLDALVSGGLERLERLADQRLGGPFMLRHRRMLLSFARGGGGGNWIDDVGRQRPGTGRWNHQSLATGRALDLAPGAGGVHGKILFAMTTLKIDVHSRLPLVRGTSRSLGTIRTPGEKYFSQRLR